MDSKTAHIKTANGNIYLKQGTSCSINLGIADIRDVSKRGGTFSKQLIATWSDNNHHILGQLFDINATSFEFDFNAKVQCEVIQNGEVIVEDAFLQLVEINESQNTSATQQDGDYVILVKSAQRDLFTRIGGKELTDLDFTYLNHTYSSTNVVASFTNDVTDGYVYPMGVNDTNSYLLTDFRPAIYVKHYFDQIHATNGFSYDVIDWAIFDNLVIPYNGEAPLIQNNYDVHANKSSFSSGGGTISGWSEALDEENLFTPSTGVYDVPIYLSGGQGINLNVEIDLDYILDNTSLNDAYLVNLAPSPLTPNQAIRYLGDWKVYKNSTTLIAQGQVVNPNVVPGISGISFDVNQSPISTGDTTIGTSTATINIPIGNVLPTDVLTFELDTNQTPSVFGVPLSFLVWKDSALQSGNNVTVNPRIDVNQVNIKIETTANTTGFGFEQDMNLYIPKKVKQKDFIKSVCNMAFLMAYPDSNNPNKIIYQPRDAFYDQGSTLNWEKKIDKKQNQLIKFLPELGSKRKIFTYKEDKDVFNTTYKNTINKIYGQAEFIFDSEFQQKTDKLELIFSPTPMTLNAPNNAIVPSMVGGAPKNNIRILLHNGASTCNNYDIYDFGQTGIANITTYPTVSHFDDHYNPTVDINFAVCDYYFYPGINLTNNNLFNLHFRRSMSQINSGKMLTAMFDLNSADIASIKLNDKIFTRNAYWNINKVIDYNANKAGLTKVELITTDEEVSLPTFDVTDGGTTVDPNPPINAIILDVYDINNINYSQGLARVVGTGNVIGQNVQGVVIGNDQIVTESGYYVNGEKIPELNQSKKYTSAQITTSMTVNPDEVEIVYLDDTGIALTLPDPDLYEGESLIIKDVNQGGNEVIASVSTIDQSANVRLSRNQSLKVVANNGIWNIIHSHKL